MSNVVAKVNGKEITEKDLEFFFRTLGQQIQSHFQGPEGKDRLLDELIYQELFYAEAMDNNLVEDAAFLEELNRAKEGLLRQYNIRKLIESVQVTEEEAEAFYKENQDKFVGQATVEASHILVDTLEEADRIRKEIAEGLDFAEAAKKYSSCPSKAQGGSLGSFGRGQMVPEFEEAAFSIAEGTVSEPVQTQFGYHLILKTGETSPESQTFEDVKDNIYQQLLVQKQNKTYVDKVESLKSKYDIERM
jgi:peptidyl-prolyl cis-trans isomerase C